MEVVMFIQPTLAMYVTYYHRLDLEDEAYKAISRRRVKPDVRPAKVKIPARVPRSWRWRYLLAK
jgi:hypothetical protein